MELNAGRLIERLPLVANGDPQQPVVIKVWIPGKGVVEATIDGVYSEAVGSKDFRLVIEATSKDRFGRVK